jgi:hypothetical protein
VLVLELITFTTDAAMVAWRSTRSSIAAVSTLSLANALFQLPKVITLVSSRDYKISPSPSPFSATSTASPVTRRKAGHSVGTHA